MTMKRAEHENDDIDAMLQEILDDDDDDDYQPISTHVSQQNLAMISQQSNTFLFFK